jgi:hypothetical protein
MKYEIEQMLKTGGGPIVNATSIFGLNGYPEVGDLNQEPVFWNTTTDARAGRVAVDPALQREEAA